MLCAHFQRDSAVCTQAYVAGISYTECRQAELAIWQANRIHNLRFASRTALCPFATCLDLPAGFD
jgi:hypothetical protein